MFLRLPYPTKICLAMENYTDNELREELQRRGYCTTGLWHIDDVRFAIDKVNQDGGTNFTMNDSECMEVLEGLFGASANLSAGTELLEYAVLAHLEDRQDMSIEHRSRGR